MYKQFTTPTITIQLEGAEETLAAADEVILTARAGQITIDKQALVTGDSVSATFSQLETARLNGTVSFEVTIRAGDTIVKSDTVKADFEPAVRQAKL